MRKIVVSTLLRTRRKELGLSIKQVSNELKNRGIVVSDKAIYSWEGGYRQPDADTFLALCSIYDITDFRTEAEKSPPESAEATDPEELEKTIKILTDAFTKAGYIGADGDISDSDFKIFRAIIDILDSYFSNKRE